MSTPGVPNRMTAANATEHNKNAKQTLTDGQGTNKRLQKHCWPGLLLAVNYVETPILTMNIPDNCKPRGP